MANKTKSKKTSTEPSKTRMGISTTTVSLVSNDDYGDSDVCSPECPNRVSFQLNDGTACNKFVQHYKDDNELKEQKGKAKCKADKSSFVMTKADGVTQKNDLKNQPGQADKAGQITVPVDVPTDVDVDGPLCEYPCDVTCEFGCYDQMYCNVPWHADFKRAAKNNKEHPVDDGVETDDDPDKDPEQTSEISCHCFKSDESISDDESGEDGEEEDEDDDCKDPCAAPPCCGQNKNVAYDCGPCAVTARYLDTSGGVIYPCNPPWCCPSSGRCARCCHFPGCWKPSCFLPQPPCAPASSKCCKWSVPSCIPGASAEGDQSGKLKKCGCFSNLEKTPDGKKIPEDSDDDSEMKNRKDSKKLRDSKDVNRKHIDKKDKSPETDSHGSKNVDSMHTHYSKDAEKTTTGSGKIKHKESHKEGKHDKGGKPADHHQGHTKGKQAKLVPCNDECGKCGSFEFIRNTKS